MSIVLFFGLAAFVTITGFIFSAIVIRHHVKLALKNNKSSDTHP